MAFPDEGRALINLVDWNVAELNVLDLCAADEEVFDGADGDWDGDNAKNGNDCHADDAGCFVTSAGTSVHTVIIIP